MSELETTMAPLHGGKGYASLKYVDAYLNKSQLPNIHDRIGRALAELPAEYRQHGAFDLGACHGLLTIRAAAIFPLVVGLEPDQRSVDVFNAHLASRAPNATLMQGKLDALDPSTALWFSDVVARHDIRTFIARRALPETLAWTYGKNAGFDIACRAGRALSELLVATGIKCVVLEGRVPTYKSHANPLWNADLEVQAMGAPWSVVKSDGDVRVMVR